MTSKIDRLFGSKTRVALLAKLLMNSDARYHIRQLSRDLGIPYSVLYKEVKNLSSLGVLSEENRGKLTLVSVNKGLPFFPELRGIMVKTAGLSEIMGNELRPLKSIIFALVFGSFAAGEESESSDIDVLVVGHVDEETVLRAMRQVEKKTGREINYILWTPEAFGKNARASHHLLAEIARNPFIMIVGDEAEFRRAVKK